ncbi:Mo-dependent nitrogenase C-terminal domain-containing protein [Scytonema sp. NUACC26]|uniref:Mo-dependent nitrogenase C-terminal domain-containing protein n=1 Tax=Scytonema sp. NUACC26 TaxID=3140176 RepID=UPI0034DC68DC
MLNFIRNNPYQNDCIGFQFNSNDLLQPIRGWFDRIEITSPKIAHFLCKLIPVQCPFERDIYLFGQKVAHIPPLCKLNPFYEQVSSLRFRALCYLADECGEDVRCYC